MGPRLKVRKSRPWVAGDAGILNGPGVVTSGQMSVWANKRGIARFILFDGGLRKCHVKWYFPMPMLELPIRDTGRCL
jgi:hypothetical protein